MSGKTPASSRARVTTSTDGAGAEVVEDMTMGVCVVKNEREFGESGCVCRRCAIGPPFEDGESNDDTDDVSMASFRPCRSSAQGRGGIGIRRETQPRELELLPRQKDGGATSQI
jgi:hypothetical protein